MTGGSRIAEEKELDTRRVRPGIALPQVGQDIEGRLRRRG